MIKRKKFKKYEYKELDLTKDEIKGSYDIVLCNFVLMFISTKDQLKVIDKLIESTNKFLLIETRQAEGKYSYTCYIENFYHYIQAKKNVKILYYNKQKERILVEKWENKLMDI